MYGLSKSDTSSYTEREKRAIRRNHVREAESLVNPYVDTHRYQDRVAAQQTQVQLSLVGSDLSIYTEKEKPYSNLDLFVVPEETDRSAVTKSIGGATKTN
ncbi:hypothetical protein [Staphylococcus ursi]|uniref:hypothetical protein n=1 Tax=Staphylococcus sp. MI 10-1553 TaxID=1912064 RepID=UPI0023B300B8|nr:hypothetical protein [Staphylococcus sp. MI 10-1553]